jgi:hypothetical protein
MLLRLEEIKFNHDSSSASVDAFNIRKNETEFIDVPEWRRGVSTKPEHSPAAYARGETRGNTLTIEANFSVDGTGPQDVCIRALDANFHQEPVTGSLLSPQEVQLLQTMVPDPAGNVLGEVKAKPVTFSGGKTGFQSFDLQCVRIWDVGVGRQDIVWRWQFRLNGTEDWIDLAVTTHRIYTVLNVPTLPWLQIDHEPSNTQLPWIAVLDHTCASDWAGNAQDTDEAAARITQRVFDLGGQGVICYASTGSTFYTDRRRFDCSSFLARLDGTTGKGKSVNCDDCAAIVSTFANSVGCNLSQMCIRAIGLAAFKLKPHVRIGIKGTQECKEFLHHQVASEDGCGEDVEVFDACLQIGDPAQPGAFMVPTNLRFKMGESGYHFRLVATEHQSITTPHPDCKRRRLAPAIGFPESCGDTVALERHFEFASWRESAAPGRRFFFSEFFLADYIMSSFQLDSLQKSKADATPSSVHSLWSRAFHEGTLFRIDLYETESWQDARKGMMTILSTLQEPGLVRQHIEGLGDVTFADPTFKDVLFAAGNLVFYLRNVCSDSGPVIDIGRSITQKIFSSPEIEPGAPDTVRRFSFETSEGAIAIKIRLREEPAHPLAPPRLYRFIADAGEVSLDHGKLFYLPRFAGVHELRIFAIDGQGKAILQSLRLTVR